MTVTTREPGTAAGIVTALARHRVVAVVRHADAAVAAEIARACIAGGLHLIEITLTTPGAVSLIADLSRDTPEGVLIGAGTVLEVGQLDAVVDAGARFLVSPVTDRDLLVAATTAGVAFVPGASTPSEIALGARLGAPVVKVFPAGGLGLPFLRAVTAVLPHVPLFPSGGIAVADVPTWLDAGALAVAVGSELDAAHAAGGVQAVTALAATAARIADHRPATTRQPTPWGAPS